MPQILPGVYIEVRPEGLIVPAQVTVGNLGVVGTAARGPVGKLVVLSSFADAKQRFYEYDPWIDGKSDELTLVRALEQAFAFGASTVIAVRVAGASKSKAAYTLKSTSGECVKLTAKSEGTWGNDLSVNVSGAEENASIEDEAVPTTGPGALTLKRTPVVKSARNRIRHFVTATGITRSLGIIYDDSPATPNAGQVKLNRITGALTFAAGEAPVAADKVTASYVVDKTKAVKVTLRLDRAEEVYTVVDGKDLAADIKARSAWVDAEEKTNAIELPSKSTSADTFAEFTGGDNGEAGADYQSGLDVLLNEEAHIMVAAGQDDSFGNALDRHCQQASTDTIKHDRIAVVGSKVDVNLDDILGHNLDSDRVIFVAPGIRAMDAAATPPVEVTLPGAYAAAAVAGLLSSFEAHISLTNKPLSVDGLETKFSPAELEQLVQARVLALEDRRGRGIRVVKSITTNDGAFRQITTRRIVDFAKFGVRSAADPFIGSLNNDRVRKALKGSINGFLAEMVISEMLTGYELDVTATRDEEKQGIARVTMTLKPTFSIDFIKVVMFLG